MGTVSALSARDIWSIVDTVSPATGLTQMVRVLRWNGIAWRPVVSQPRLPKYATLSALVAQSPQNIWVGGRPNSRMGTSVLARHWNGRRWQQASPSTAATSDGYAFDSAVTDGHGGLWVIRAAEPGTFQVRHYAESGTFHIWHYADGRWSTSADFPSGLLFELAAVPHTSAE